MGWDSINRRTEELKDRLAADPEAVRRDVDELLADARPGRRINPSGRLRLVGLAIAAGRKLGDLEAADQTAAEGSMIVTKSPAANADFLLHLGALRLAQYRAEDTLRTVNLAEQIMKRELAKPQPSAKESRRRRRWMQSAVGVACVLRGEVFLHMSEGSAEAAFNDAFEAMRLTSDLVRAPSYTRRVHLSGVTLLCALLVQFGPPAIVEQAVELLDHAERILIYRCRVPPDHVHRIKIKWGRALTQARLGFLHKAETLLIEVVEQLIAKDWKHDAGQALDALVWVIEQSQWPVRAGYFVLRYKSQCV
ncbi:MAG: hypothetical protein GY722_29600 [bacterium]|nr:hypothetical protein [bacterium]